MPKLSVQPPKALAPYLSHKLDLNWDNNGTQATGDCPFCGQSKFFVGKENGVYSCKTCEAGYPDGQNGNSYSFLRKLYQESSAKLEDLALVAKERKIGVETLQHWGLVQSIIDHEWMLPGYGFKGEVNNLYRWTMMKQKDNTYKRRLIGTATMNACLFGVEHWAPDKPTVFILEGPWDGMKFDEALQLKPETYEQSNIVAVPGCETFKDEWIELFRGKDVCLAFDNDRPKPLKNGKLKPPAGFFGMRSAAIKLKPVANSIQILNWGEEGYDPDLDDGFDCRDYLTTTKVLNNASST